MSSLPQPYKYHVGGAFFSKRTWDPLREVLFKGGVAGFYQKNLTSPEKNISKLNNFTLVFYTFSTSNAPKAVESPPLCALPPSQLTSSPISDTSVTPPPSHPLILGWLLSVPMMICGPLVPKFNTFPYFVLLHLMPQTMGWCPPTRSAPATPLLQPCPFPPQFMGFLQP